MGKALYVVIFMASLDPMYKDASDASRRALLATQMMKEELADLESHADQNLYRLTGLHREDFLFAAYAYPLVVGKISTKPFSGFKYTTKNHFIIRPEIEYGLWNHQTTYYLGIVREF